MAERKKTEYYSDELLAAVEQLRDGGNPHDIADRLNSLAVDMRNFAIVSYPQLSDDLQICLDIVANFNENHETAFTALLPLAYYTPLSSIREKPFPGLRSTMKADVIRRETPSCLQSFRSRRFTPAKRGEPLMAETANTG